MKKLLNNKKFILIASIISSIVIVSLAGTMAWYFWSTNEEQRTRIVTSVGAATVVYEDGASMTGINLKPVEDKEKGIVKNISVRTNATNEVSFNLYLDINELDDGLKDKSFRYELWKEGVEEAIVNGDFSQDYLNEKLVACEKNSTNHLVLLTNQIISKTTSNYVLYIWIDGVNYTNPDTMMNQNFSFKLHADGQGAIIGEAITPDVSNMTSGTLAYNIVNKYNNSTDKTAVTNGGVRYHYDTTNNLMADVDGNVRYYGANPNNYIYFNCDDYANQSSSTCEVWRIIGVFDGKVKIVRNSSIGNYSWDYTSTGEYDNNWHNSGINTLLNYYYNNSNNVGYYNNSTTLSTINFKTDNIGIKNTKTQEMISKSIWYLGGHNTALIYADEMYRYERGDEKCSTCIYDTTWTGNVGLLYPSDYGYATDLSVCSNSLMDYDKDTNCTGTNWFYNGEYINNYTWFMTPNADESNKVFTLSKIGYVYNSVPVRAKRQIFPTLYLDEDVVNYAGNGSSNYPYRIWPDGNIGEFSKGNAAEYITNLYLNANPEELPTNDTGSKYYSSETVNLLNDGFDSLGNLTNSITEGNIRYYLPDSGVYPNNYIYFNCDDYNQQTDSTCEKWRIIGVFDGKIKIVRNESIGKYSWDYTADGLYDNNWHDSTLMTLLNDGYYYNKNNITYYNNSTKAKTINFATDGIGIKNDVTRSFVSKGAWYLGAHSSSTDGMPSSLYKEERGNIKCSSCTYDTTWQGNIGLIYPSDLSFTTGWFSFVSSSWLLTPYGANNSNVVYGINVNGGYKTAKSLCDVFPSLFLDTNVFFELKGNGSENEPYQLMIK